MQRRRHTLTLVVCTHLCFLNADARTAEPTTDPVRQFPSAEGTDEFNPQVLHQLLAAAQLSGSAQRGAILFSSPQFACISCHKVGDQGGSVGPELTKVGSCLKPEEVGEALLWPNHRVRESYVATVLALRDGSTVRGYKLRESAESLTLRDPQLAKEFTIAIGDIEQRQEIGSLMPAALVRAMQPQQQADLVRFLLDLGHHDGLAELAAHAHKPASFNYVRDPLFPLEWPSWQANVNRDRVYDYYTKEAAWFAKQPHVPLLLPEFPGLDNGQFGHWGNQNEQVWADGRWNQTDTGTLLAGVFRGAGETVPKGVCIRLGDNLELSACFDPQSATYPVVWKDGFVEFSDVRHGFMHGLTMQGTVVEKPDQRPLAGPLKYQGFYRDGAKVVFRYRVGDIDYLDAPDVRDGLFVRTVARVDEHPAKTILYGGASQWPEEIVTKGTLGTATPYAVDTIELPFPNPWNALMFVGAHDFTSDGTAFLCTMQGDVWRVRGLDNDLSKVRWKRFASGLHQPLGMVIHNDEIYVQCRDQITKLHDINNDGEADFYECFSNIYETSPAGHDFICGLERDENGWFYTVSGNQGLFRISPDGTQQEILATGFRNPDGLGITPTGSITVPCSEGEWTPSSMIAEVPYQSPQTLSGTSPFYGYGGPKNNQPPELPLVYLPRGLDNSSGGQISVTSDRWGPLKGQMIHLSFGAGAHFLLLRQQLAADANGPGLHPQVQGAIVPLPGEFLSGAHRARFAPHDGQLYVSGMAGWGSYTPDDGCFQRVRYTGEKVHLPVAFEVKKNGMLVTFSSDVDPAVARGAGNSFAQAWNYRYSSAYGSAEFSPSHYGMAGHDHWPIERVLILDDKRTVFYHIPDIQPVNMLHLQMNVGGERPVDLFATVHVLGEDFKDFPGYAPLDKAIAAHPMLVDLATATKMERNPFRANIPNSRELQIEAGSNLTYSTRILKAKAGEPLKLTFQNPDVVPHNWVLVQPGTLAKVGDLANRLISSPEAAAKHYVPQTPEVLYWTDVVPPGNKFNISFRAPDKPGRYPYLCTFPGHWMVMNGELVVE